MVNEIKTRKHAGAFWGVQNLCQKTRRRFSAMVVLRDMIMHFAIEEAMEDWINKQKTLEARSE